MKTVCAVLTAKAGCEKKLEDLLNTLFDHVKQEPGTICYTLNKTCSTPGIYYFYEQYEDEQAAQSHLQSDFLSTAVTSMQNLLAVPPTVEICDIINTTDVADKTAGKAYLKDNATDQWVRRDLNGKQKRYCACWKCTRFKPEQDDKGCPIIKEVLDLATTRNIILPVWACRQFSPKD